MSTPSAELAEKVVERLVREKLLSENDGKKLVEKIANGTMRPEDWRLPLEVKAEKDAKQ